ncbi:unnamed protein product [Aphanomyces euteiches]
MSLESVGSLVTERHIDALLIHRILQQKSMEDPLHERNGGVVVSTQLYSMVYVSPNSIFVIGTNGHVYERFFNGKNWEFVQHNLPDERVYYRSPGGRFDVMRDLNTAMAITRVAHGSYEGIVVADKSGYMIQRVADEEGTVRWIDCSVGYNMHVYTGGYVDEDDDTMYVVTHEGDLYARHSMSSAILLPWHTISTRDLTPYQFVLVLLVRKRYVYVLTKCGRLIAVSMKTNAWSELTHVLRLSLQPGLATPSSLFLIGNSNGLLELVLETNEWIVHGHPPNQILYGALATCGHHCILALTEDHTIWQFSRDDSQPWFAHADLPRHVKLALVPPIALEDELVVVLEDGRLATKVHCDIGPENEWIIHCVPEAANLAMTCPTHGDKLNDSATINA